MNFKNRFVLTATILIAGLFVLTLAGLAYHLKSPVISSDNIESSRNKIASNAPIIISFNQLMNRASVESGFKISPDMGGTFKWSLNEMTFVPEQRFTLFQTYTVTIPGTVKNILGRQLGTDIVLTFIAIETPKVSLAVPNEETAVDSKITIMFDRPMKELTTYDEAEKGDFPLQLSPAVEGRFKWIGTSAFQFIPKDRLAYSTEYTAAVPVGTKALDGGQMEEAYTFKFRTPRIKFADKLENSISASSPFKIYFNQDINLDNLLQHLKVTAKDGTEIALKARYSKYKKVTYDKDGKKTETEIEDKKIAEILPKVNDWGYDNAYILNMTKEVSGVEGNLTTESEIKDFNFATVTFLTGKFPQDKEEFASPTGDISLQFDQEVDLGSVRNNFSLNPTADFNVNYGKKCDPKWEPKDSPDEECAKIDDFATVVFTPKAKLKNVQKYEAVLKKDARAKNGIAYLKKDETWTFTTADTFKIIRSAAGSYENLCLFTNNEADVKDIEKLISVSPGSKGKITARVYKTPLNNDSTSPYHRDYTPCIPKAKSERFALYISFLLVPDIKHTLTLAGGVKDTFGQTLGADFKLNFDTEALKDFDTSLDILQTKFYATTTPDQHAYPVISTRNLNNFDLEICKLDAAKIMEVETAYDRAPEPKRYVDFGWDAFVPSEQICLNYKKINKKLKNTSWEKQYFEVDLARELGGKPESGYYYIQASSPRVYKLRTSYVYASTVKDYVVGSETRIPIQPSQLINITNLHLTLKSSGNTALLWATDLTTGKPISGVNISLYSSAGDALPESLVTDKNGIAKYSLHELPFNYALASYGKDNIFISINWTDGISPWEYQMSYSRMEKYTQGYIYTDRPLYQPTHEVFFKGIFRDDTDATLKLPQSKTMEVEIFDSRDTKVYKQSLPITPQGTFSGSIKLAKEAPLGRYVIYSCLDRNQDGYCQGGTVSQDFYVEEYRKPEYKMDVTFSKEDYVDKDELRALLDAQYFFGAPVSNAKANYNIVAQNYYFDEYKDEWFSFTDYETFRKCYWGCPYEDQTIADGSATLDDKGQYIVTQKLDLSSKDANGKVTPPDTSKIYTLSATVQDKNNQSVTGRKEAIVHRGEFYVGVKNDKYIVNKGEEMPFRVITVDPKGTPLPGKSVRLELYKVEWKYVKKKNVDGVFYFDNEQNKKLIDSASVTTGDDGKVSYGFGVKDGGEYFVKAIAKDGMGNTFSSTVDFYATTNESVTWKQDNNNRMELKLDKMSYSIGDTAKIFVKSPYQNVKALVTYERGDIMDARVIDINSNAEVISIPITEKMLPNFYISVLEVKGGNKTNAPDFKLGYANVVVDSKAKELVIAVKTDKKRYQPRDKVNLEIITTDTKGRPVKADVSVAVVDASLLALKGNPVRDLVNYFYNRKDLGVRTADNLTRLLERINISDIKGAKGGSGKGSSEYDKPRGDFQDTALWRSSLSTDVNGKFTTSFTLPDNLTTWNIEAIGNTAASLFGSQNETITTQKAVMVRPVLPRFVLFKDSLRLGAIIHNFTDKSGVFTITLDTKNLNVKSNKQMVRIASGGSAKVLWDTTVPTVANGTFAEVTISADGNGANDAVIQKFPIYSYSTPETVSLSSFTDDISYTEKVRLPAGIDSELGELKITTGATLATYISDSLNYLMHYPYGCTEQILSRIVPSVVVKNAVSLPALKDKIKLQPIYDINNKEISLDAVVANTLQKLYSYQTSDGGWGYFPESKSYAQLTAYTLFGFEQLKNAGYSVDSKVISRASFYLQDYLSNNRDLMDYDGKLRKKDSAYANGRAYMLFVMAEIGRGDTGLTNSLYEDRQLLSNGGKAYLAMTLNKLTPGQTNKIKNLIMDIENQARIETRGTYVRNNSTSSVDMMTNTKTTALTIQLLTRINPSHPLLPKLVKWLIAARSNGRWSTTQDNVAALNALLEYLKQNKETEAKYSAKISVDKKAIEEYSVDAKNILDTQEVTRAMSELNIGGENEVVFTKDGTGRLYYDMVLKYFLPIENIKPRGEGFNIERNYYRVDDKKMEKPINQAKAGETLRGHLTIVVPEERHAVAVENFLPAGFELVNFEFDTSDRTLQSALDDKSDGKGQEVFDCMFCNEPLYYSGYYSGFSPWTHKELRDDRLFLFADSLQKGVYEYDYFVQVSSEGNFHNPPALVSEMYFPENFGRTQGQWMRVN